MTDSFFLKNTFEPVVRLRRFIFTLAIATFFLMVLGSTTRVMNAGLSCPDWPLCYGEIVPAAQMNLQVFLEWFHRLVASSVGLLTLILTGMAWWYRDSIPRWLPWGTTFAMLLVLLQGLLGGLTVTELLRFDIVTAHLGTGLLFFSTLLTMAIALMPYQGFNTVGKLGWVSGCAVVLVYLQSILGGLVASQWALHQCLSSDALCSVVNIHILGVIPASVASLTVVFLAWRTPALHVALRRLAYSVGLLLSLQIIIGISTYKMQLQIEPLTIMHQAVGAALLGTLISFTVLALRDRTHNSKLVEM